MPVSVMDLSDYVRHLDKAGDRVRQAALTGVRSAAARAVPELVRRTREAPPANPAGIGHGGAVNTGALVRGWRKQDTPNGADVFNPVAHAPIAERGRRPGAKAPPLEVIVEWARRRLGMGAITNYMAKRLRAQHGAHVVSHQRATYSAHVAERDLWAFARIVQRNIARRGLLPRPMMTAPDFQRWLEESAVAEIGRETTRALAEPRP